MFTTENEIIRRSWRQIYRLWESLILHITGSGEQFVQSPKMIGLNTRSTTCPFTLRSSDQLIPCGVSWRSSFSCFFDFGALYRMTSLFFWRIVCSKPKKQIFLSSGFSRLDTKSTSSTKLKDLLHPFPDLSLVHCLPPVLLPWVL